MTGKELQNECRFWGLPVGGRKSVLISRLEANNKGQKVLPFKLALTTPCKRTRNQSRNDNYSDDAKNNNDDDDDVRPSQKEIKLHIDDDEDRRSQVDDVGSRIFMKKGESDDDVRFSAISAATPPVALKHALQEDHSPAIRSLQGREIATSNLFSLKGSFNKNQLKITAFLKSTSRKIDDELQIRDNVTPFDTSLTGIQGPPSPHPFNQPG